MCTIWQRIGRCVRRKDLEGKALIFVEGKFYDEEKQKKVDAAQKRADAKRKKLKCKAADDAAGQGSSREGAQMQTAAEASGSGSRAAVQDVSGEQSASGEESEGEDGDAREEFLRERRILYSTPKVVEGDSNARGKGRGKGRHAEELEPALDDMVNAGTREGLNCYRAPPMIYFGNDKLGNEALQN